MSDPVVRHGVTSTPPPDGEVDDQVDLPDSPKGILHVMSDAMSEVDDLLNDAKTRRDSIRLGCLMETRKKMGVLYASAQKDVDLTTAPGVEPEFVSYKTTVVGETARKLLAQRRRARSCLEGRLFTLGSGDAVDAEIKQPVKRSERNPEDYYKITPPPALDGGVAATTSP